jgi:hypothetical protein
MPIPEETIDAVRAATNIVEVIGQHLPLTAAGRNYKALCPFHEEKTPSFMVSPERQTYHCFGCGAGGNCFTFLMKHQGLEFLEALELLASRAGILLPRRHEPAAPAGGQPAGRDGSPSSRAWFFERLWSGEGRTPAPTWSRGHPRGLPAGPAWIRPGSMPARFEAAGPLLIALFSSSGRTKTDRLDPWPIFAPRRVIGFGA